MRWARGARRDVLGEGANHAERILECVPARDLENDGRRGIHRTASEQLDLPVHTARRAVLALERGGSGLVGLEQHPARAEHSQHGRALEILVLRREDVDRRRDHGDSVAIEPLPGERLSREHVRVGVGDVWAQEVPCVVREVVRPVEADVAAPDGGRPGRAGGRSVPPVEGRGRSRRHPGARAR